MEKCRYTGWELLDSVYTGNTDIREIDHEIKGCWDQGVVFRSTYCVDGILWAVDWRSAEDIGPESVSDPYRAKPLLVTKIVYVQEG